MGVHNLQQELRDASHTIADPGDAGRIVADRDLGVVELDSAAAEARTLVDPNREGIRLLVRMKTDGGDITLTAANGLNVTGNTVATLADVGDQLDMISVSHTTGYRWEILKNTGSVALS